MPLYTKESLETLRQKIDLIETVSGLIELKRSGTAYKALCPFHEEKTPSFMIQRGDTHYHCFGCGAHGDAIEFLMSYQKLSFSEAVETLADRFNVTLQQVEGEEKGKLDKSAMKEALDAASLFFHSFLLHTQEGNRALQYLYSRKISLDFIHAFEVGYAPKDLKLLKEYLNELRFSDEILYEAGLLTEKGNGFFRERITFPMRNPSGQVVGFSARKFKEETFGGKYINSPETALFKKSRHLFGLNFCRRQIAKERRAIIVEGQIDCLKLIHAGLNLTVAALGTAFGQSHVQQLQQLAVREVYLLFDPDEAGKNAASKVGDLFQKVGIEAYVASLPFGMDPDQFLLTYDIASVIKILEQSVDYLTFQVQRLTIELNGNTPAGKNALIQMLRSQIKQWDEPVMVHESLKKLAHLTFVPEEVVGIGQKPPSPISFKKTLSFQMTALDPHRVLELDLLRWLVLMGEEKPYFLKTVEEQITSSHFWVPICKELFIAFFAAKKENRSVDVLSLFIAIEQEGAQEMLDELLKKKINREKADRLFLETVQKLLDRQWMQQCEEIKQKIQTGSSTAVELETFVKEFNALKKNRPQAHLIIAD